MTGNWTSRNLDAMEVRSILSCDDDDYYGNDGDDHDGDDEDYYGYDDDYNHKLL